MVAAGGCRMVEFGPDKQQTKQEAEDVEMARADSVAVLAALEWNAMPAESAGGHAPLDLRHNFRREKHCGQHCFLSPFLNSHHPAQHKTTNCLAMAMNRNQPSSSSSFLSSCNLMFTLAMALCCWVAVGNGYPAFYMQTIPHRASEFHNDQQQKQAHQQQFHPQKRAFDRLDVSPFDFDAMTKRFNDDELLSAFPYLDMYAAPSLDLRKRAFDRLEDSGFFGLHKRAFDRLDNSFMLIKRNPGGGFEHDGLL